MIYIDGFIDPLGSDFSFAGLLGERCFVYMQQVFVLSNFFGFMQANTSFVKDVHLQVH